ncbi:MAG: acyltransferase [Gammaproteobacteria bacterium]|nr:acyltransferase [Gammaproteobacteria bacterium]MBU1776438.1 acyltransferase [Gammaproteobacteria bacterium]
MSKQAAHYSLDELSGIGFAKIGSNVCISRKCSIYAAEQIQLGDNVRIDDFCILSGKISLGSNIHVAAYTALFGGGGIELHDFCNLSSRVSIYSVSDDYSGETLTNPTIPEHFKHVERAPVVLGRHVIVGAGTVVLPGVTIGEGSAIGALSLVNKGVEPWGVYAGVPVRRIKNRKQDLLKLEIEYLRTVNRARE